MAGKRETKRFGKRWYELTRAFQGAGAKKRAEDGAKMSRRHGLFARVTAEAPGRFRWMSDPKGRAVLKGKVWCVWTAPGRATQGGASRW